MIQKRLTPDQRVLVKMCEGLLMDFLQYAHEGQLMEKNLKQIFLAIERFVEERLGLRASQEDDDE